jgi:hypothetical protein
MAWKVVLGPVIGAAIGFAVSLISAKIGST